MNLWLLIISFLFSNVAMAADPHADCVAWFNRAKIKAGTRACELSCATTNGGYGYIYVSRSM